MVNIKKLGMAAGTFSVALGIGFVMQNGDALASRFGSESDEEQPAPFTEAVSFETSQMMEPEAKLDVQPLVPAQASFAILDEPRVVEPDAFGAFATILPEVSRVAPHEEALIRLAALDPEDEPEIETDVVAAVEIDCVPIMTATSAVTATISLVVSAPCHSAQPFTIHHQGMMFTALTDIDGTAGLTVPALAEVAVLIAAFADGSGAVATTAIPDFAEYDRAVLQWQGGTSVMLSAYEGDANYGEPDHIHAANPGDMARLIAAEGGYLVRLGISATDDALMAEVYTFPTGTMGSGHDVMLVAEAEITVGNCGQEIGAQSIQVSSTGQTAALDLTMIMPDCDAIGDFLILQNMFEDLTIATK